MTTTIYVCDTCSHLDGEREKNGQTGGEAFYQAVAASAQGQDTVKVERFSCLMGCKQPCNVSIQSAEKISYLLNGFDPQSPKAAEAVVEYATKHADSETGVVPFKEWPQGIKGKFRGRMPSAPA